MNLISASLETPRRYSTACKLRCMRAHDLPVDVDLPVDPVMSPVGLVHGAVTPLRMRLRKWSYLALNSGSGTESSS